jgi:hypothetical protein
VASLRFAEGFIEAVDRHLDRARGAGIVSVALS